MSKKDWFFWDSGFLDGLWNMALDEALIGFYQEKHYPILRFYGWKKPYFSIGRYQKIEDFIDYQSCSRDNIGIVRRMTGGGAIFHHLEFTYSLVCSSQDIGNIGVKESYARLCRFLLKTYHRLGIPASYAFEKEENTKLGQRSEFCFAGKEKYDITIEGKKIGGNAQRRIGNLIFQHGSVPILNQTEKAMRYLKKSLTPEEKNNLALKQVLPSLNYPLFAKTAYQCFEESMETQLIPIPSSFLGKIYEKANDLLEKKYKNPIWNEEGKECLLP